MLKVVYFSWVREAVGVDSEKVDIPETELSVHDLCELLATRSEGHARAFSDLRRLRVAIDLTMADLDATISGASEIAFFPPVTGG